MSADPSPAPEQQEDVKPVLDEETKPALVEEEQKPAVVEEEVQKTPAQLIMPTDLPKEILLRIIKMTTEGLAYTTRYRNLKRTALVAKAWTGPSQELLCRDAVFHNVRSIEGWLEVRNFGAKARAPARLTLGCTHRARSAPSILLSVLRLMDDTAT